MTVYIKVPEIVSDSCVGCAAWKPQLPVRGDLCDRLSGGVRICKDTHTIWAEDTPEGTARYVETVLYEHTRAGAYK